MNKKWTFSRRQTKAFVESHAGLAFEVQCQACGWMGPRFIEDGLVSWICRHPCRRPQYNVQVIRKASPFRSTLLPTLRRLERFAQDFWTWDNESWEEELRKRFRFLPGSVGWKIAAWLRAVARASDGGGERDLPAYKTCVICGKEVRIKRKPRARRPRKPLRPRPPTCGSASCRVRLWRNMNATKYNDYQARLMAGRRTPKPPIPSQGLGRAFSRRER